MALDPQLVCIESDVKTTVDIGRNQEVLAKRMQAIFTAAGTRARAEAPRHGHRAVSLGRSNGTRDVVKVGRNQAALHGGLTKLLAHTGGAGQLPLLPNVENAVKNEVHLGQNQEVLSCVIYDCGRGLFGSRIIA